MRGTLLFGLTLVSMTLGATAAIARTLRVPSEYSSISGAMGASVAGDVIEVACGVYAEHDIVVTSGVTLRSTTGDPTCVTIDAGGMGRVLFCSAVDSETRIEGLTLRAGQVTGGATPGSWGGGVLCVDGASPEIVRCVIIENVVEAEGGGLACYQSSPYVEDCVFRHNGAGNGGAVSCYESSVSFDRCSFVENTAPGAGAGISAGYSPISLTQCDVTGNIGAIFGGGIALYGSAAPLVTDCTVTGNYGFYGGGMSCTLGASPMVTETRFVDNVAYRDGVGRGGGLYCGFSVTAPLLVGCTFEQNQAGSGGGAYARDLALPRFDQCLFIGNSAASAGGGLHCRDGADAVLRSCTFAFNAGVSGGGALYASNCSPMLERCILAFQTSGRAVSCVVPGNPLLSCCNIFGNAGGDWIGDCMDWQAGRNGNFSVDPLFCDPEGGDFALQAGSPCLPGAHPQGYECDLIGAYGQGCGTTSVERRTWGNVKSRFE